ncbi:contact-dependent growth inhibition system immunity protein [Streptomyces sp. NPDC004126]|uniref:contact-dependent growth inhibition system immunity protein n=1 Tax=Streptomyces sp. NPDC004126 TaxID=3390695 RepID=UPI003CFC347E
MDRLLHLGRTLDDLDPPRWGVPDADATPLIRKVHALRTVPLGELRPADLRMLVSQQVALRYVLPLAVRLLLEDPLLDAHFYGGDLLHAVLRAPATTWALLPDLHASLRAAITALPASALADLPRDTAEASAAFTG